MTLDNRAESWFTLASGRKFRPFAPRAADIEIEDIALALSNLCRFNGHCHRFYSVAEHSIHCSSVVPQQHALAALMHDATEAFVGDMIRPIKKYDEIFSDMEEGVWLAICERYGIEPKLDPIVKWADDSVLKAEARDLLMPFGESKFEQIAVEPPPGLFIWDPERGVEPLAPDQARVAFLELFEALYTGR